MRMKMEQYTTRFIAETIPSVGKQISILPSFPEYCINKCVSLQTHRKDCKEKTKL